MLSYTVSCTARRMDYIEATQAIPLSDYDETDEEDGENGPEKKLRGHLKVLSKPGFEETQFPVYEGTNVIGRQESCDIHLPLKALSKEHACIEVLSGSHIIYDKGSRNKTRRLKLFLTPEVRYELRDGDNLIFGDVKCIYTFAQPPRPEDDAGSETGSESMLEDPQEKALIGTPEDDPSEPSSDLIEPSQSRLSPKSKAKMVPMLYATDSEDDDDLNVSVSQPFVSVVKETPTHDGTLAIADSDDDSFVGRRHGDETTTLVLEDSTVVLDDSTLAVTADNSGQETVVAETQVYDMENDEGLAPTQPYSLKPEEETIEDKSATKSGKGKQGSKNTPKSTKKAAQGADQTVTYTLEAADYDADAVRDGKTSARTKSRSPTHVQDQTVAYTMDVDDMSGQNVKSGFGGKGRNSRNIPDQTVAYTMDVEETSDKAKQTISETVAYNMDVEKDETSQDTADVEKDETSQETTDDNDPEATQSFTADEAEDNKPHRLFLGNSSTLAFDDDFDDTDTDGELSGTKSAPRQESGTFKVGDDGEFDAPTQVFPDEKGETQVLASDETQVFDDMKGHGNEEATQVLPLDEPSTSKVTTEHEAYDETQVFEETVQIPCGDETQVFDSPKRGRVINQMDETQVMSDSDIPTLLVKKSPSPKKKVQWAMEATQMFADDDDGTDGEDEASPSFATPANRRPKAAKALLESPMNDTQVLDNTAESSCPVLLLEATPEGRPQPKSKALPAVNLEATQLLDDDFDSTQMLDSTCPTLQVNETPFSKSKARPSHSSAMDATQVIHDVSDNFDATQMLDETCPTLQVDETPLHKTQKKKLRTSDFEATQVIGDISANFDATQMLDETCPTLQVDETPLRKTQKKNIRTSDFEATQIIGDVSDNFDATQMLDETCPTLQVDETPFRKPAPKSSFKSDMAVATQVFTSDGNATQMFDETCPTLDIDEEQSPRKHRTSTIIGDHISATQIFGGDETQMLSDDDIEGVSLDCPTLEVDETPVRKAVKKPTRGSDVFAATQMFIEDNDDSDDGDLPDLDDACPTLEVSNLESASRPERVHSPFAATQILGGDEMQALGSDNEELDKPEDAVIKSPVRRRKPSRAPPAKTSKELVQHANCEDETQPMHGVEDDSEDATAPTVDNFVHPDDIATQAYEATSNDDDETQPMEEAEEDPVGTAAPRGENFIHPDDMATQAYGASDTDDGNESEEIDFGLPMPILPSPCRSAKTKDTESEPPHEPAASATDDNKRESIETKGDHTEDMAEDSEEVTTMPGDEEATQAYALLDGNEEEEDEMEQDEHLVDKSLTTKAPDHQSAADVSESPRKKGRSKKSVPPEAALGNASVGDESVILLTETPAPRKRGRPTKSAPAKSAVEESSGADESVIMLTGTPTPRQRGRPPKAVQSKPVTGEPSAAADESVILLEEAPSPRKRGRPSKSATAQPVIGKPSAADDSVILLTETPAPRQRGRPAKAAQKDRTSTETSADQENAKPCTASRLEVPVHDSESEPSQPTTPGKRGRPRKSITTDDASNTAGEDSGQTKTLVPSETEPVQPSPRGKRGRPRKSVAPSESDVSVSIVNVEPPSTAAAKRGRSRKSIAATGTSEADVAKTASDTNSAVSDGTETTKVNQQAQALQTDKSEVTNAEKAKLEVPTRHGRGRKSNAQADATTRENSPIQSTTKKGKSEVTGKPDTSSSQTTEDSQSTVDDSSQQSVPRRRGKGSAVSATAADNTKPKESQGTDSQDTESQQSVSLGKRSARVKRKTNEVDSQSTTDDTEGTESQQLLSPARPKTRGKRKSSESDTQSITGDSQNSQTTDESQSSQFSKASTRGRRSKVDDEIENKRSNRRSNVQSEPEPSERQKTAAQSKGNSKKSIGAIALEIEESSTGTRGSRSRNSKLSVIEEDSNASSEQVATINNPQKTKGQTAKQVESEKGRCNTQRGRRRTVQSTPDEAEDTVSVVTVDSKAEKTRQNRRRTIGSITTTPSEPVQNRRRSRKDDDSVSVASEDGDVSGSQGRSTRGRKKPVQEPVPETSTKKGDEQDENQSDKPVQGRGRKSTAPLPTIKVDLVKNEDEVPELKSHRGKGRSSVADSARDPTPDKSQSPQQRGRSKGRGGVKTEPVELKEDKHEYGDDFKAVPSGKRAMKRQASTDSVASNSVTKKQRGGKEKTDRTQSPARSQQNQSQPSTPGTPTLRHRSEKLRIMFTGVVDNKGQKTIKELGGELADNIFDCTHLVTDKVRRTVKFLCGVARGLPIISIEWLNACREAKTFVDVTPHLVKDPESEKTHKFKLGKSIAAAAERPMLQGYKIHVTRSVMPDPKQMKDIIASAGGEFLSAMPRKLDKGVMIVSCQDDKDFVKAALEAEIPVVSAEFLLTGVLRQEVDLETHRLFSATAAGPSGPKKRRK